MCSGAPWTTIPKWNTDPAALSSLGVSPSIIRGLFSSFSLCQQCQRNFDQKVTYGLVPCLFKSENKANSSLQPLFGLTQCLSSSRCLINICRIESQTPVSLLYRHTSIVDQTPSYLLQKQFQLHIFFKLRLKLNIDFFFCKAGNPKKTCALRICYSDVLSLYTILCLSQYKEAKYKEFFPVMRLNIHQPSFPCLSSYSCGQWFESQGIDMKSIAKLINPNGNLK